MNYMFASFKSRAVVFQAYNYLISKGVKCAFTSTPREVYLGCGLSIKFSTSDYPRVRELLSTNSNSFSGYWQVTVIDGKKTILKV